MAAITVSRPANLPSIQSEVGLVGREYSHDTSPSAKKFLERSASRGLTPRSWQARLVRSVMGAVTNV